MRSSAYYSLIALLFLVGALISAKFGSRDYAIQKLKVPNTPVLTIGPVLSIDSMSIIEPLGQHAYTVYPVEFINNHQAVFHLRIPVEFLTLDSIDCMVYGVTWLHSKINLNTYANYFSYFQYYDKRNFLRYFNIGGLALLFFFSFITVIITRKPLLFFYNLIVLFNLILLIFREFHFNWLHIVSFDAVANLMLFLFFVLLVWLLSFYERWNLSRLKDFPIPQYKMIGFVGVFFLLQLPIYHQVIIIGIQRIILCIAIGFVVKRMIITIQSFALKFRLYIYVGYVMIFLQWLETFHILPFTSALSSVLILVILTSLGISISQFILKEFVRNTELSQQRFRLQKQIGQLQIISLEKERKLLYERLNNDVLSQVDQIAAAVETPSKDHNRHEIIEKLSRLLQSIRDYSYSLFPPYLDKLDFRQLLQREIDKIYPNQLQSITLNLEDAAVNQLSSDHKLWLFRVFQSYIQFFELGNQKRPVEVRLQIQSTGMFAFHLRHEISERFAPIFKSYNHSDFLGYVGFLKVNWRNILSDHYQGWELEIPKQMISK